MMSATETQTTLTIPLADDFHVHLRDGDLARSVTPLVRSGGVGRCLVMPNVNPPIRTAHDALNYQRALSHIAPDVTFLMTLFLHDGLTREELERAAEAGVVAIKCYPRGVTTHSEHGATDLMAHAATFAAAEELGLVLCIHGEVPNDAERGIDIMNAEEAFLPELERLHSAFPDLRIVLEHVSTAAAVNAVRELGDSVAATITAHHLLLTSEDWADNPYNFCKPVAKTPADRDALRAVIKAGHPKFFLGSDSAPHRQAHKECEHPKPGIFTTPILLPLIAQCMEELDCLDNLVEFAATFGRHFYRLAPNEGTVTLQRTPLRVPNHYGDVVPFAAGTTLNWSIPLTTVTCGANRESTAQDVL